MKFALEFVQHAYLYLSLSLICHYVLAQVFLYKMLYYLCYVVLLYKTVMNPLMCEVKHVSIHNILNGLIKDDLTQGPPPLRQVI